MHTSYDGLLAYLYEIHPATLRAGTNGTKEPL
jgi:hypothetical protein